MSADKDYMVKGYLPTIGIECHVQLKTKSKLFSAAGNDAREAPANTLITHIDLGMPGALPVLNQKAVELATRAAFALNIRPQKFSKFDRKHYFYPDLPMGYQITQFYDPIIKGGEVEFELDGKKMSVRIHEAHLEADAGKSIHPAGADYSLVDLNRAGTPLLEIVSEPDMHTSAEAKAYVKELQLRMRYADVSEASLYYGNMRFDVNVSVSKNPDVLGTRTETKNLNSFKSVERAIDYEIARQISKLDKGEPIVQETLGWDEPKQKTTSQRSKEEAHDYRYMPDPDLPPIVLSEDFVKSIESTMPIMPAELRDKFKGIGVDSSTTNMIIDEMTACKLILSLLDRGCSTSDVKRVANWLASDVQGYVSAEDILWSDLALDADLLIELSNMVATNKVNSTAAKTILLDMIKNGQHPEEIAKQKNLLQVSDASEIEKIVKDVLLQNPKAADDIKAGELKAIGFLVGQVMKESKGQANPAMAQELIKNLLKS